jgi:hypothetical protein
MACPKTFFINIVSLHITDDGDSDTIFGRDPGEIYYKFLINGEIVAELNSKQAIQAYTGGDIPIGVERPITVFTKPGVVPNYEIIVSGGVSEDDSDFVGTKPDSAGIFVDVFNSSNGWQGLDNLRGNDSKTFQRRLKDQLDVTVTYTVKVDIPQCIEPPEENETPEQKKEREKREDIGNGVILYMDRTYGELNPKPQRGNGPFGEPFEIPQFRSQSFNYNGPGRIKGYDFPYVEPDDGLPPFDFFKFSIQPNTLKSIKLGTIEQVILYDKPLSQKSSAAYLSISEDTRFLLTEAYGNDPDGWENKAVSMEIYFYPIVQ